MFTNIQQHTQKVRRVSKSLMERARELLKETRKNWRSFSWEAWRELVDQNGGLRLAKKGEPRWEGKTSHYLALALLYYLDGYLAENNALPAGFFALPERTDFLKWLEVAPEVKRETKEHIKSLLD